MSYRDSVNHQALVEWLEQCRQVAHQIALGRAFGL